MRIMRTIAWIMCGLSAALLIGGVWFSISFAGTYGPPDGFGELVAESWWLGALVAWPAAVGWLLLRIARKAERRAHSGNPTR
jgi:hypothetical protein